MRLIDVLLLPSDDHDGGGEDDEELVQAGAMNSFQRHQQTGASCGFECSSPRKIVSTLLRKLKGRRRQLPLREGSEKESVDGRAASPSSPASDAKDSAGVLNLKSSFGSAESDDPGSCGKDNVSMGVACCLLYLIASSKDELSKMKELRADMEMLLQNVQGQLGRKDLINGSTESLSKQSLTASSCLTDTKEVSSCRSLLSSRSNYAPILSQGEESIIVSGRFTLCDESRKESVEGMDQLEAELAAELELLEIQLDTEKFPQSMKVTGSDTSSRRSDSLSLEEMIDPYEVPRQGEGGVPPIELERKLRELLESRQQERIKELEAALEGVKQKLSEKEREVSWWKDNTLLMSRHVPDPSDDS